MIIKDRKYYDLFEAVKLGIVNDDLALGMFYGGLIRQMWVVLTDHIPGGSDAAVFFKDTQPVLLITPVFFEQTFVEQVLTLNHELLHLILKHTIIYAEQWNKLRIAFMHPTGSSGWLDIMNFGCDLVVNGYLPAKKVPSSWLKHEQFGFPAGMSAIDYAKLVIDMLPPESEKLPDGGSARDQKAQELEKLLVEAFGLDEEGQPIDPHLVWIEGHPDVGEANQDPALIEEVIQQMIMKASDGVPDHLRGNLPGVIQKVIEKAGAPSVMAWHSLLRRFNASVGSAMLAPTMVKRNRITGQRPGNRLKPRWKLAIILDGSGSVDQSFWVQFVNEVHWAWKNGAEVWVIKHDAVIFSVSKYDGKNLCFDRTFGGTDHTDVIEYLNKHHFDGAVAMTDGYTGISKPIRPRCRFAWVITPGGTMKVRDMGNCNFGMVIPMKMAVAA